MCRIIKTINQRYAHMCILTLQVRNIANFNSPPKRNSAMIHLARRVASPRDSVNTLSGLIALKSITINQSSVLKQYYRLLRFYRFQWNAADDFGTYAPVPKYTAENRVQTVPPVPLRSVSRSCFPTRKWYISFFLRFHTQYVRNLGAVTFWKGIPRDSAEDVSCSENRPY